MSVQDFLPAWVGAGNVIIHLSSGREVPGILSAVEDFPLMYQVEVTQGQQAIATVFHGGDVVAITLPNGQRGKKRK